MRKWRYALKFLCVPLCLLCLFVFKTSAQQPIPSMKQKEGGYQFIVDGKPFLILGAQLWNSSDWPYLLEKTWPQLKELHCNTLEAPVYWQNIEPEQGKFNFKELDYLITTARKEGLRLVLLWFGSYKNGSSQYPPEWVLMHPEKYPRMKNAGGEEMLLLSAVNNTNRDADKAAFAAMMQHIKQTDEQQRTVIMVQVQNECGSLGTDRDYSEAANELFTKNVPAAVLKTTKKKAGNWEVVFGADAAEAFNSWYIASYINTIAEAGKKEYALPMYVNAWPREHGFQRAGEHPSGGPVSSMLEIWKAAAPSIDLIAPDVYLGNYTTFNELCRKYSRDDNPLFIPEMGKGLEFARHQFYALGNYNALGVAPYGIDPFHADPNDKRAKDKLDEKFSHFALNYNLLNGAIDIITRLQGTGRLLAVGEEEGLREQLVTLGDYDIMFTYGFPSYKNGQLRTGRALIGQTGEDEFVVIGFDTRFQFRPKVGSPYQSAEIIVMDEGYYENGQWVRKRIWNGDEVYHSTLTPEGTILKIKFRKTAKKTTGKVKANFEQ
jgi:Domain of unknown function (DUF5597)/Beta-galactosidase